MSEEQDELDLMQFSEFSDDPEVRRQLQKIEESKREPLNSRSMIEDAFFKNLGSSENRKYAQEYANGGSVKFTAKMDHSDVGSMQYEDDSLALPSVDQDPSLYEKASVTIADARDYMIKNFPEISHDELAASVVTKCILKLEAVLAGLGFEVADEDKFDPMIHASGLKKNDILTNAKQVEENTKRLYSTFKITASTVEAYKGKPCVAVRVEGQDETGPFAVIGTVLAKQDFEGNEAIDYVRKNGEGAFSVKSLKLGRWQNVTGNFHIYTKEPESAAAKSESSSPEAGNAQ